MAHQNQKRGASPSESPPPYPTVIASINDIPSMDPDRGKTTTSLTLIVTDRDRGTTWIQLLKKNKVRLYTPTPMDIDTDADAETSDAVAAASSAVKVQEYVIRVVPDDPSLTCGPAVSVSSVLDAPVGILLAHLGDSKKLSQRTVKVSLEIVPLEEHWPYGPPPPPSDCLQNPRISGAEAARLFLGLGNGNGGEKDATQMLNSSGGSGCSTSGAPNTSE